MQNSGRLTLPPRPLYVSAAFSVRIVGHFFLGGGLVAPLSPVPALLLPSEEILIRF